MKTLKSLTFASATSAQQTPVNARRLKLIGHLEDQIVLARDPQYMRLRHRWVQDDGTKTRV
jgi:hypothetical protein